MVLDKLKKKVKKIYGVDITATLTCQSVVLNGEMSNWQDIVKVGKLFANVFKAKHVVNDINLIGHQSPPPYCPEISDDKLSGKHFDIVVIGGGIVGCAILRELSRYDLKLLLVEKHSDVAHGASGANDGMVHAGIDIKHKCKKLYYGVRGNAMFDKLCSDLDVPFERKGQYVIFPSRTIKFLANTYLLRARRHKIKGIKIISKKAIDAIEPTVSGFSRGAMKITSTGSVSPYKLTIAYAENAIQNGAEVSLDTCVSAFNKAGDKITEVVTNRGTFSAGLVINCAGVFADKIAEMASDRYFSLHPRKGTDILMDKNALNMPKNSISLSPTLATLKQNKNTKGGGIVKTVDGNILLGPDAVETPFREDISTTKQSVDNVFNKQKQCCPTLNKADIISYFSGVRACTYEEDFIIEPSPNVHNLIHVAGIQSPGLTAAPAIAVDVQKMAVDVLALGGTQPSLKQDFNEKRIDVPNMSLLDDQARSEKIKADEDFGKIVCRCEEVSLGEIKQALLRPLSVPTIDGVKRRTRAGMGRCQGGFCMPLVAKAISEYTGIPIEQVRKGDRGSNLSFGLIKDNFKGDNDEQ